LLASTAAKCYWPRRCCAPMRGPARRTETQLPAAWLNIILEDRPGRVPALYAATRGRREEMARVLGEPEKRDLAQALQQAIHSMRHPEFDNPQLG